MRVTRSTAKSSSSASHGGATAKMGANTAETDLVDNSTTNLMTGKKTPEAGSTLTRGSILPDSSPAQPLGLHEGSPRKKLPKKPQKKLKKFNDNIFSEKSKLATIDLAAFLSDEKAWNGLKDEQKSLLKALCPMDSKWGQSSDEQPNLGLLMFDMHWKSDVRIFKEDLMNGFYEKEWVEEAEKATQDRDNGKYDKWKLNTFEAYWGQKMHQEQEALEERRQQVSLTELFADGFIKKGDEWFYSRPFGKGKMLVIEYEIELHQMDDYGKAEFHIRVPAGGAEKRALEEATIIPTRSSKRLKSTKEHDAITIQEREIIDSPVSALKEQSLDNIVADMITPEHVLHITTDKVQELERQLFNHDGRKQKPSKIGSWQYFAVRRNGSELGRLVDLRDKYLEKHAKYQRDFS